MRRRKVLLIGWDAADWKVIRPLIDAGKMPNVHRLVKSGVMGQIATLHPPLSPMLWTSIATGKRPFKHGVHGFTEPTPDGLGIRPVTNLSRKAKAIWNILNQNDLRSVVIGWWPSHPAEPINGVMVSDHYHRASGPLEKGWPLLANAVHPPDLAETLAGLRMHPDLLTPEVVEAFIPQAREIDQDKDKRLAACMRTLCECISIQSAAAWLLDNEPWDLFAVYYDAIDHFCHGFMRYHPPRQTWIPERDFELYHNVVSMAYQFHDQMLGTLLQKAGEDVTVILMSDHGFHPDHLRPRTIPDIPAGPAIEHRDYGILAMTGPGVKKDALLHGSSVLDIAPTVLSLYGLPVGQDMDGKVLCQAFEVEPRVEFIPSWESVTGDHGCHPPHTLLDPVAAHAAMEQMIALGYIERPDVNTEVAVANTIRELQYNLGEAFQDDNRHMEAYTIFRDLYVNNRDEPRYAARLFSSCQALGLTGEMRDIAGHLDARSELADYLNAQLLIAEKRYEEALEVLGRVRRGSVLQTGDLLAKLRRWREAERVYAYALEMDPDNVFAHLGLCRVALHRRRFDVAVQSSLEALQRVFHSPDAHYLLGIGLAGLGEHERAADAFRAAISFNPNFPEAHVRLAALLEKYLGDSAGAREHRRLARRMRNRTARRRAPFPSDRVALAAMPSQTSAGPVTPVGESLVIVTGLPRSGTSMLMQMLAAGGMETLTDGRREADEDNPHGYLEFEPVKNLLRDSEWLAKARGKAIKIVAPLLAALPPALPCRIILSERDLDEVLDSQERMLSRRGESVPNSQRRQILKEEYGRLLARVKADLAQRSCTQLLTVRHADTISDAPAIAAKVNEFLGGILEVAKMAAAVDAGLHRNRAVR